MTLPLLILRPAPGDGATLAAARAAGLDALAFALFATASTAWAGPDPQAVDALLLGSANALRLAGPGLAAYAGLPALCVGEATAQAAREAGLAVAAVGQGGLQALLDTVGADCPPRLLRLAGAERVALTPPAGVTMAECTVYASRPQPMPATMALLLRAHALPGAVVMLHSAAAARHLRAECARLSVPLGRIHALAIGPRVAEACAPMADWAGVHVASAANDKAMLALALQLCHNPPSGAGQQPSMNEGK
ncbi:MAG TPA: uroporphyrinogen-III synthase [Novosphingobium sp.]|nr:uroporphyrinogen-III synthase [Novosphingobium sp.]